MSERRASATRQSDLFKESGAVSAGSSSLFTAADTPWASRPEGLISLEELIAAAYAASFCLAFSNELSSRDQEPARLGVFATTTFDGGKVTRIVPDAEDDIPGFDEATFREELAAAEESSPLSIDFRTKVDIQLAARSV